MNAPTVTKEQIDAILAASEIQSSTIFDKVTVVSVKLPNGFVLVESSGAVCKENYDAEMGRDICMRKITDQIWKLEGYCLQNSLAK